MGIGLGAFDKKKQEEKQKLKEKDAKSKAQPKHKPAKSQAKPQHNTKSRTDADTVVEGDAKDEKEREVANEQSAQDRQPEQGVVQDEKEREGANHQRAQDHQAEQGVAPDEHQHGNNLGADPFIISDFSRIYHFGFLANVSFALLL